MPPRAAYLHVPFCRHRCGYCNFTVVAGRDDLIPAYLEGLEQELSLLGAPRPVDTLFLGGGTPTHLAPDELERLLQLVAKWFPLAAGKEAAPGQEMGGRALAPGESPRGLPGRPAASDVPLPGEYSAERVTAEYSAERVTAEYSAERGTAEYSAERVTAEYSIEANPRDITPERVAILRQYGVDRLSLGAQSFDDRKLRLLERDHDAAIIRRAVELARPAVRSISLDLIFGTPGETLADWERDLEAAIALAPDHLSAYGLTFERGTRFWSRRLRGEFAAAPEESERAMYLAAIERLTAAGYEHYEVSNFAGPKHRSRHNETYWRGGEYFAAGPGAARYVAGRRETNHRSTSAWLARLRAGKSPVAESEQITPEEATRERVVFGLRMREGVDLAAVSRATGLDAGKLLAEALRRCEAIGAIERIGSRVRLTREGLLISDSLWPQFWTARIVPP